MFVIVAVNAEEFPVAAVRGIIVVVVIFVVNGQFAEIFPFKFSGAAGTDMGK
jgi:hypothetical protein